MKISTKGRYAIRVILDIAMHDDGKYIPLKDIAKRQDLTVKYLEQIISLLNKAGYYKVFVVMLEVIAYQKNLKNV